jgi:hypothetical protein
MGAVTREDLTRVIRNQFESVVRELTGWRSGVMVFTTCDVPDLGAVHVEPSELLTGLGLETDGLLKVAPERPAEASEGPEEVAPTPPASVVDDPRRSLLEEMRAPSVTVTAEMTLGILGAAGQVAERGILFLASPDGLNGIGGFGLGRGGRPLSGRRLRLPRSGASILSRALEIGSACRGPLEEGAGTEALVEELGGAPERDVVAVPLVLEGATVAVLYMDGGSANERVGDPAAVEAAMAEVATALEAAAEISRSPVASSRAN